MDHGPLPTLLFSLAAVLVAAKLAGHVAVRWHQPAVMGELAAGILLGNLSLVGIPMFDQIGADPSIEMLAQLGVILLLFQVGLESTVGQMLKVGLSSILVATMGVVGPFVLGWSVGAWLIPSAGVYAHIFLGAALTATSVGITARVMKDLGRSQTTEARIILGAAIIDDVQGLIILAVVSGLVAAANLGGTLSYMAIGIVVAKAALFLVGSLVLGVYLSPHLFSLASRLQSSGVLLATGLAFCFVLSWMAGTIGLAPLVGAFAAGLVLEDLHSRDFVGRGENALEHLIEPIASFLVPVFFVVMGLRTELRALGEPGVLGLASVLTLAAILGKQLCGFGAIEKGIDRLSIGIGMVPRGEVGLIFANMGLTLVVGGQAVVPRSIFSAVVVMVIVTTALTPPALKWSFERHSRRARPQP